MDCKQIVYSNLLPVDLNRGPIQIKDFVGSIEPIEPIPCRPKTTVRIVIRRPRTTTKIPHSLFVSDYVFVELIAHILNHLALILGRKDSP